MAAVRSASRATRGRLRPTSMRWRAGNVLSAGVLQLAALHAEPAVADHGVAAARRRRDAVGNAALGQSSSRWPNGCATLNYETAAIGKMHFNGPSSHGFALRVDTPDWERHLREHPPRGGDHRRPWRPFCRSGREWLNAAGHSAGLPVESMQSTYFVDRAIEFLSGRRDKPFFLVVSFYDPHSPFQFPRDWQAAICARGTLRSRPYRSVTGASSLPSSPRSPPIEVRGIQAAYFTSLSFVDAQVGRLIQALDAAGLAQDTLVVYVGDNGYMLGPAWPIREALHVRAGCAHSPHRALAGPRSLKSAHLRAWSRWSTSCRRRCTC